MRSEAYDQADFVYVFVRAVGEGGQQVGREADAANGALGQCYAEANAEFPGVEEAFVAAGGHVAGRGEGELESGVAASARVEVEGERQGGIEVEEGVESRVQDVVLGVWLCVGRKVVHSDAIRSAHVVAVVI